MLFLTKSDHRHRWERDSISRNKKKANETPHEEPNRIFMFRVTKEHTKRTKKKGKKRGTRDVRFFFRCRHRHREETRIVVVTFFTSLSRSLPTTLTTRTLTTRKRERKRDPVVATSKRKREKGGGLCLLKRTLTVRIEKKNVSTTVSSFLILQKRSFVASNARSRS